MRILAPWPFDNYLETNDTTTLRERVRLNYAAIASCFIALVRLFDLVGYDYISMTVHLLSAGVSSTMLHHTPT
jgi:hypothetical protein